MVKTSCLGSILNNCIFCAIQMFGITCGLIITKIFLCMFSGSISTKPQISFHPCSVRKGIFPCVGIWYVFDMHANKTISVYILYCMCNTYCVYIILYCICNTYCVYIILYCICNTYCVYIILYCICNTYCMYIIHV